MEECSEYIDLSLPRFIPQFNCKELPLKNIKYILGPSVFYHYEIGGRNIYMFGEFHDELSRGILYLTPDMTKYNTVLFSSFLTSLVKTNTETKYDVMFENVFRFDKGGATSPFIVSATPTIDKLTEDFHDCIFEAYREKCPYENMRIHYVDYRKNEAIHDTKFKKLHAFVDNFYTIAETKQYDFLGEMTSEMLDILHSSKIQKQFKAIVDLTIRKKLYKFFKENIESSSAWIQEYIENGDIANAREAYILTVVQILDMYALSRILRNFTDVKKGKQFVGTGKDVIYYAGKAHIDALRMFFEEDLKKYPIQNVTMPTSNYSFVELDVANTFR